MLLFSSQEGLPSGQLANPFNNMSLESQPDHPSAPRSGENSQAAFNAGLNYGMDSAEGAQGEVLCTPDFITPVDQQFGGAPETEGAGAKQGRTLRSPAQLSPSRQKRPRQSRFSGT